MDKQLLREVVSTVLTQELLLNWRTYALMLAFGLLHKVTSAWIDRYAAKRAEHAATRADFDEILVQLKKSTNAAEEVRSQIAKIDWLDREWRTIRRIKLEEMLSSAYSALQSLRYVPLNKFEGIDHQSVNKLRMICSLYFPELRPQVSALYEPFHELAIHTINCKSAFDKAAQVRSGDAVLEVNELHAKGWELHYTSIVKAHGDFELAAADLMTSIAHRTNT